jgi:hypothetical protein
LEDTTPDRVGEGGPPGGLDAAAATQPAFQGDELGLHILDEVNRYLGERMVQPANLPSPSGPRAQLGLWSRSAVSPSRRSTANMLLAYISPDKGSKQGAKT